MDDKQASAPAEATPEYWDKLGAAIKAAPRLPPQDISRDPPAMPAAPAPKRAIHHLLMPTSTQQGPND